ncbi:MAG: PaaI family thioesterase [Actinomycetota bacterium]|nr:PaaI family thioesterase [Actinomycetota bacterium]
MTAITLPWLDEPKFQCFGCSPRNHIGLALTMHRVGDGRIRSEITFSENYASYPGVVHGGIVGVLVDEIMGDLLALDRGMLAFSTTLRTKFLMPLRVGVPYTAEARISKEGAGVVMTEADVSSADGEVHVMANGTYQPIRSDQAKEFMGLDGADYDRLHHYFDHRIGQS